MDNLESQLNSVLGNPEMMRQIMSMAQGLNGTQATQNPPPPPQHGENPIPNIDPAMLQKISGILGSANIDRDQRALLSALSPYLSQERIRKLENAMRASRLAGIAAKALGQNER